MMKKIMHKHFLMIRWLLFRPVKPAHLAGGPAKEPAAALEMPFLGHNASVRPLCWSDSWAPEPDQIARLDSLHLAALKPMRHAYICPFMHTNVPTQNDCMIDTGFGREVNRSHPPCSADNTPSYYVSINCLNNFQQTPHFQRLRG